MQEALRRAERRQVRDYHHAARRQHRPEHSVHAHEQVVIQIREPSGGREDEIEASAVKGGRLQMLGAPVPQLEPLPGLSVRTESATRVQAAQLPNLPTHMQPVVGGGAGPAQAASLPPGVYDQRVNERDTSELAAVPDDRGGIMLRARQESWIEVRSERTGAVVFTKLLRAGEEWPVPEEEGLRLTTGNAGGVEILVDGTKLKSLGTVGLVKRDIPLDAEKLKDGSAFTPLRCSL